MKARAVGVLVSLVVSIFLVPLSAGQKSGDDPRLYIRIETANAPALAAALEASGVDVVSADRKSRVVEAVVTPAQLDRLNQGGLRVTVVDQTRPLAETLAAPSSGGAASSLAVAAAVAPATYRDLDGVIARMYEIALAYPAIAQVVDLTAAYNTPPTVQGRHMFALKISDNVAVDEDEPAMMVVAAHHAREISTPVIGLYAAEQLTSGYDVDPRITAAVNGHEIWIAPVWNPDGYNHVFTVDNMWRKNRRVFTGGTGVDQNRNYPQGWSASCAGSTSPASDTYKGPSAGSEAETQTMMMWSQAERFAKVIDYHSYGREVLYAYRCLTHPFRTWMQQEAAALSSASGYGGLTRLPSAEGEHPEWQFARMGAYAFLIETHTQFQPPYESALAEAALVWPGVMRVIERPISVSGHVTDATTGLPLNARIDLLNVTFANGETNASGGQYGAYHMFMPPGTYDVRFSATGYAPSVQRVTVTATSAAVVDVQLSPSTTVFADDFESATAWTRNPFATDTATSGLWERGDPQATTSEGPKQLGTTTSGLNNLVTGRLAGTSAGANDLDGGRSSIQSPAITLPSGGSLRLSFNYYFAHGSNSSNADYLRISIAGTTTVVVFEELGGVADDDAVWATANIDLTAFAGQTIRIVVEAADASGASLVEAAVDDVKIERVGS